MSEYPKIKLGNLIDVHHGFAFKGTDFVESPSGKVVVTPGNFSLGGGFKTAKLKWLDNNVSVDSRYVFKPGDLVVTMTDLSKKADTLGFAGRIPEDGNTYLHNQRIGLVEVRNPNRSSEGYLHWVMRSKIYQQSVVASATGTTVHHTSPSRIHQVSIPLPPIDTQHLVSTFLDNLERSIELNRQINRTLEDLAQVLYRHWFVDFGPFQDGEFVDSELGMIPSGWAVSSIYDLANLKYGRPYKSQYFCTPDGGRPLIKNGDLRTFSPKTHSTERRKDDIEVLTGDLLGGMDAEFLSLIWLGDSALLNQRVCKYEPTVPSVSRLFLKYALNHPLLTLESSKTGTTVIHLGKRDIDRIKLIRPSERTLLEFSDLTNPLLELQINLSKENRTLKKMRDFLLPRLLSGEVTIDDVA
jgi:type I restriction enzyme, S subunit